MIPASVPASLPASVPASVPADGPDEAIILVGGLGTRLRPLLDGVPKALAPINGTPFLRLLLDGLAAAGMRRVILATGFLADQVRDAIGARHGGLEVAYSVEDAPLGTGGAAFRALGHVTGRWAWLLNGDTFVDVPWAAAVAAATATGADVVLTLRHVPDRARYGAVTCDGARVTALLEKGAAGPGLINAGAYLLRRERVARGTMPEAFSLERDLLQAGGLTLAGVVTDGPFLDIGTPDDFARAQTMFPKGSGL